MVIFHLINNVAINSIGGGAELFAIRLLNQLQKKYQCHLVIAWKYNTDYEEKIISKLHPNIKVHYLTNNSKKGLSNFYLSIKNLSNLIKLYSPKIINSHSAFPDLLSCFARLRYGSRIRSVRTVHTNINWFKNPVFELVFGNVLFPTLFDIEIAISKATQDRLNQRLISRVLSKCSPIIYNGISEDIISFQNNAVMLGNKEANRIKNIITIGRLTAQKGYNYLLEAIALLKDTLLFNLYIFGEGSQKEDLMNQSKSLHLTDIVKFMGFHDNVLDYMSESDLFVSSSLWEGFPTVILEAMACGLPVVATDVSGSRELIINNYTGILVHPKRPDEIAGAINLILNSPNLARRFSKNSRSKITEYLITNVAKKYENIYSQISQNKK